MMMMMMITMLYAYIHIYHHDHDHITLSARIPNPLPLPFSIVHRPRSVFMATPCIGTGLLYIVSSWSTRLCSSVEKSVSNIVDCWFFTRLPSRIRWIVKICDVRDWFLRKPFLFSQSMFSILGSMRLRICCII